MKVLVAEKCGFCHGVRNAISVAEKTLTHQKDGNPVYSFGPIIHNSDEVERLAKIGLTTVDDIEQIQSGTVLIRSHGAAPEQIAGLRKKCLNIVDATCVLVKKVQHIAKELASDGYEVVIIGDEDHPEVQAVRGYATNVVVIADEKIQLDRLIQRSITQKKPLNVKEAQARIHSQMPLSEKVKYAHFVVENSGGMDELKTKIVALWEELKNFG